MVPKLLGVTPHHAAQDLGFYGVCPLVDMCPLKSLRVHSLVLSSGRSSRALMLL